jgi:hypothetical protein
VSGNQYLLIVYEYDSNYIHAEPMIDRTGPSIIAAYQRSIAFLQSRGFKPLLQRLDNEATDASETMCYLFHHQLRPGHQATYARFVATERPHKTKTNRVRLTVGGNLVHYPDKVSTPTADLSTVKLLLNSVISTPGARFATFDLKDFYLGTPMMRK